MKKVLEFLRITDPHDGLVSLTNIALMVVIGKLAFVQSVSVVDLGALLLALANYNAKKVINGGKLSENIDSAESLVPELAGKIEELKSKLNVINVKLGLTNFK